MPNRASMLEAAAEEMIERGFKETTMASIAQRADCDLEMLEEEFADLNEVYDAVLKVFVRRRLRERMKQPKASKECLAYWANVSRKSRPYLQLLMQESLHIRPQDVEDADERFALNAEHVRTVESLQQAGELDIRLDSKCLMILFASVSYFPVAFPQLVRFITNQDTDSPDFQKRWDRFLGQLADKLHPKGT